MGIQKEIVLIKEKTDQLRSELVLMEKDIDSKQYDLNKIASDCNILENQITFDQNKLYELERNKQEKIKEYYR